MHLSGIDLWCSVPAAAARTPPPPSAAQHTRIGNPRECLPTLRNIIFICVRNCASHTLQHYSHVLVAPRAGHVGPAAHLGRPGAAALAHRLGVQDAVHGGEQVQGTGVEG